MERTSEETNKNENGTRESERRRMRDGKRTPGRETTYVLRRAPSGYSRDGVRSFLHFISALKMLLRGPSWHRMSRGSSFSPTYPLSSSLFPWSLFSLSVRYRDLLSFSFNEQRLRAFALTTFQFVRIPLPFSINYLFFIFLSLSQSSIVSCRPSLFQYIAVWIICVVDLSCLNEDSQLIRVV